MNFGHAIRTVRESKGVSQRYLASELKVSHSYISHIENGTRSPSLKVLTMISDALDAPLHVLALFAASEEELRGLSRDQAQELGKHLLDEGSWTKPDEG